jgi:hypothetical protein
MRVCKCPSASILPVPLTTRVPQVYLSLVHWLLPRSRINLGPSSSCNVSKAIKLDGFHHRTETSRIAVMDVFSAWDLVYPLALDVGASWI